MSETTLGEETKTPTKLEYVQQMLSGVKALLSRILNWLDEAWDDEEEETYLQYHRRRVY